MPDLSKTSGLARQFINQYDKALAVLALMFLLVSLIYLAVRVGSIRQMQQIFDRELESYQPRYPEAGIVSSERFDHIAALLANPPAIAVEGWTNVMLTVPPRRVFCSDPKCLRPVPYDAEICPHCLSEQYKPPVETVAEDHSTLADGIPDKWKREFGIDVYEPVANRDLDGDGFTVIEEYRAGTDPTDPRSHPPLTDKLFVEDITGTQFGMLYRSRARSVDGMQQFGLNYLDASGATATRFVRIGDVVSGYTVTNHVEQFESTPQNPRVDVSELTLVRGDHTITLVRDKPFREVELTAHFRFTVDGSKLQAKQGEFIKLRDFSYEVMEIDRVAKRVLLKPESMDAEPIAVSALP